MHKIIRDLTIISNYFDQQNNTKIADKIDNISIHLLENDKRYNNWIKIASKNRDKLQNQYTKELINIIYKLSNTEKDILKKSSKLDILYKCSCLDLAKKLKSITFKEASLWNDTVNGITGVFKGIFRDLFPSFMGDVQQEAYMSQVKRIPGIIRNTEEFFGKATKLTLNSLALAQLEADYLSRLYKALDDLVSISSQAAATGNAPLHALTNGMVGAIREFVAAFPAKDRDYAQNLQQPIVKFLSALRGVSNQSAQVAQKMVQQQQQQSQNPQQPATEEDKIKSFERFLNRAHTTRGRAEEFVAKHGSTGKQILDALGIDEAWYRNHQISRHDKWPEAGNYKVQEQTQRIKQFKLNLQTLINKYPNIWQYLKELGMTPKGSWRQEGYERGRQQR